MTAVTMALSELTQEDSVSKDGIFPKRKGADSMQMCVPFTLRGFPDKLSDL